MDINEVTQGRKDGSTLISLPLCEQIGPHLQGKHIKGANYSTYSLPTSAVYYPLKVRVRMYKYKGYGYALLAFEYDNH